MKQKRIRELHKKHKLHHKTVFYMKTYAPHKHFHMTIVKQSIKILLLASLLSTIGGIGIQALQQKFFAFIPLLILLPALADMIGDFGTVVSSRFTTALYLGKIDTQWWLSANILHMF